MDQEELSLDDVFMVGSYLKDVLHVSEEGSIANEEVLTAAYVRHILHVSKENCDAEVLKAGKHLKAVLRAPKEVWAKDVLLRSAATYLKDQLVVSTNEEEISLSDVRAVATYLKGVLNVSEGVSATDEEMPTVEFLREALRISPENSDQQVLLFGTHLWHVLHGSDDFWSTDGVLWDATRVFKDKFPISGKVSDIEEERSEQVQAAKDSSSAVIKTEELEADLSRLALDAREGGQTHSTGSSSKGSRLSDVLNNVL